MRLRVLPLVIFLAFTLVAVKIFDILVEKANRPDDIVVSHFQALAAEGTEEDVADEENKEEKTKEGEDKEGEEGEEEEEEDKEEKHKKGEKNKEEGEEEDATLSPGYSGSGPSELEVTNMSEMERNLLENLSKRRKELEEWNASIAMKENILNATEKKINRKMDELKKLQEEVETLLKEYTDKENKKVLRLVKIYENMKPQDAANIFEGMDIDILLEVINNMKEAKSAKILSKIKAEKAKEITIRLAQQNRLAVN